MKKIIGNILISIFLVSISLPSLAQDESKLNAIQTVVPFLTIAPDSRAGAMGDAGVATSPDVFSLYWNAAKYGFIDGKYGVGLGYTPWMRNLVNDINIAHLSGYYRLDNNQVISGNMTYSSLGLIDFTDETGATLKSYNPNEWALTAGYTRLFSDHFSGSVAFKFIYSNLTGGFSSSGDDTKPGTSVAADISGYYKNDVTFLGYPGTFAFGFNLSNIGSKMSYSSTQNADFIPMNMKLGVAHTFKFDAYNELTATVDFNKLLVPTPPEYYNGTDSISAGKDPNISVPLALIQSFYDAPGGFKEELKEISCSVGLEYIYNSLFAVRAGYCHENKTKGNRRYMTAGAGIMISGFGLNVSYLIPVGMNNSPLANTLRFSLTFGSGVLAKKN